MARETILTGRPAHGYAILEALRIRSGGLLDLPEGSLYPALYRLEEAGFLTSETRAVAGRTRRTYAITATGRAELRERHAAWRRLASSVAAVVGDGPVPNHG